MLKYGASAEMAGGSLAGDWQPSPIGIHRMATLDPRIVEWNDRTLPYAKDRSVHSLIIEQCEKTPENIAVATASDSFTYAEILRRSQALAKAIVEAGVEDMESVAICVTRSENMIIAVLGCLQANCKYIPMDPVFAINQMVYIVNDGNVRFLVTDENQLEFVSEINVALRETGRGEGELLSYLILNDSLFSGVRADEVDFSNPTRAGFDADRLVYCMYTSGSTGKPKGVAIRHRNLVGFFTAMTEEPGMDDTDVCIALTTQTFDISVMEIIQPLCVGAVSRVVTREVAINGHALAEVIEQSNATFVQATPATYRLLLEAGWRGNKAKLKRVLCGGESVPSKLAEQLLGCCQDLWNMYGPTEATVWCTKHLIREIPTAHGLPIGKVIHNFRAYILDEDLKPLPIGEIGDIYIAGVGVGAGYVNLPEVTARAFKPDPFYPGDTMFKTGDLGKFHPDTGDILCLGRSDFQVKIRGYRVELQAIELHAEGHPMVGACVVAACKDPKDPDTNRLVAYVVVREGHEFEPRPLQEHIRANVPEYMVPGLYVRMDSFPLGTSGKVDRKKLPPPDESHLVSRELTEQDVPTTVVQAMLCSYACELLGISKVSVRDNLFKIGADSLSAMKIQAFISTEMGCSISPLMVFKNNTVLMLEQVVGPSPLISGDIASKYGSQLPLTAAEGPPAAENAPSPVTSKSPRRSFVGGIIDMVTRGLSPRPGHTEEDVPHRPSRAFVRSGPTATPQPGKFKTFTLRSSSDVSPETSEESSGSTERKYIAAEPQDKQTTDGKPPAPISTVVTGRAIDAPYHDLIVPIQEAGSRPPIFMVHAAGGFVYPYFALAGLIGDDQPLYAIQDPSELDGSRSTPFSSIEDMASAYVIAMTQRQPRGPYTVAGWSLGGSVAWEMAAQLRRAGRAVNAVILIDSECCERYKRLQFLFRNLSGGLGLVRDVFGEGSVVTKGIDACTACIPGARPNSVAEKEIRGALSHGDGVKAGSGSSPDLRRMLLLIDNHMRLLDSYTPPRQERGWFVSIKCEVQPKSVQNAPVDPFQRWDEFGEGEHVELPGDHFGLFRHPNAGELAEILRLAAAGRPVSLAYKQKKVPRIPQLPLGSMEGGAHVPRPSAPSGVIASSPDFLAMH